MSGYQNGYQNGGGQQQRQAPKLPQPGSGRLRKVTQKTSDKSPDFRGYANLDGRMVAISIWYDAPKAAANGQMMPESWSLKIQNYQGEVAPPNPPQNGGYAQPQQQGFQYGAPPQQQGYGQSQQGYAPQPPQGGYQRAPQAGPPPQYQPPQNGGYAPTSGQQGASYGGHRGVPNDDIPFAPEVR